MIYKHKKSNRFVDLISSGTDYCLIIVLKQYYELENYSNNLDLSQVYDTSTSGRVLKGSKTEFKKAYKKAKPEDAINHGYVLVPDKMREEVKEQIESNIWSILHNSEEVVRNSLIREHRIQQEEMIKYSDGYKDN